MRLIFESAETSQALLDAFFQVCSGYFPTCALLFFVADDVIVRRVHGPGSTSAAVGARIPTEECPSLAPARSAGELGAAAVTVEPNDALCVCGVWPLPGEALLLPLIVRGRAAAAVLGENRISEAERRDVLAITTLATTALQSIIARRSTAAAVSDATRILSEPLKEESTAARRRRIAIGVTIATSVAVLGSASWWMFGGRSPLMVPIGDLPGQPHVEALAMLPITKKASGLGDGAELVELRATVGPDGKTDLNSPGAGDDAWPLRVTFAAGDTVADVDVDRAGVYPPSMRARGTGQEVCGACGCDVGAPPPHCTPKALVDSSHAAGLGANELAFLSYSFCKAEGPRWTLSVRGRGEVRLSDSTCAPLPRESLHLPPRTLEALQKGAKPNPLDLLAEAKKQAALADGVLVRIEAWSLGRDGTLDLRASGRRARAEYTFADPPGPGPRRVRRVMLEADGLSVRSTELVTTPIAAPPEPRCTLDKLWRSGVGEAPNSALAHVIYDAEPTAARGQWTIELAATAVHQVRSDTLCAAW